jgi:hypothetical protein
MLQTKLESEAAMLNMRPPFTPNVALATRKSSGLTLRRRQCSAIGSESTAELQDARLTL